MADEEPAVVLESKIAPPIIECPHCEGMLPNRLGQFDCLLCGAVVKIDHAPTRKNWEDEAVACPACSKILVAGVDERPAELRCSACEHSFRLKAKVLKSEVQCPHCERRLRIRQKPGSRNLNCPACKNDFKVSF